MGNSFFSLWIPRYLTYLRMRNYSPRTLESYEGTVRHFGAYVWLYRHADPRKLVIYDKDFATARLDTDVSVTNVMVNDYLTFLTSMRTYRPKTMHRILSTLSSFYRYLTIQGIAEFNPVTAVDRPRIKQEEIVYLKHDQVLQLINTIEDPRDRLIIRTIYATGVRVSELCSINIEDIDFEDHIIKIRGKGGKIRTVFIDDRTLEDICTHLEGRIGGPLFIGQQGKHLSPTTVTHLFRHYAPPGITPHKIRHSYASELYRRSKNLRVVQENLGHSSIRTTEVYLHTDLDERKRVYNDYFPLSDKNSAEKKEESPGA
ncbi:MAG: tyrosine-type recombinase/integrase [Methanomicrobiales archaeon]|nr:tyrosine-type recombinase/integrase [Methanomicrobiales archaeon]